MTWRRKWLLGWVLKNEWNFCRCRNKSISDKANSRSQNLQTKRSTEYPSLRKATLFWDWSRAHGDCCSAGEESLARQCGLEVYEINLRVVIRAGLGGCAFWARTCPYSLDSPHPSGPHPFAPRISQFRHWWPLDQVILCCGHCPLHWEMFSSILGCQ